MQTFGGGPLQHNVGDEGSADGMEGGGGTHSQRHLETMLEHWGGLGETTEGYGLTHSCTEKKL